jgi:hypothetical protein
MAVDAEFKASPAIGDNGTIYLAVGPFLTALVVTNDSSPLAKCSWPTFRANLRHTGRVPDSSKN